ncbi:MAG: hypothetical protein NTY96_05810 [Bacteroidetes bacterium]|nr:hypothetical protein [Bacteroidota bacterium]
MKTKIFTLVCLILFFYCNNLSSKEANNKTNSASGTTNVYSSPRLYDIANKWAGEYALSNPGQIVKVIKTEESGIASIINKGDNICFVTKEVIASDKQGPVFQVVVGREIIVPVISPKNPFLKEIYEKGISRTALATSLGTPGKMKWGTLLNNSQKTPVRYIILDDDFIKAGVSGFFHSDQVCMERIKSENRQALISAVQNDPYAIGFCRMTDILNSNTSTFAGNLLLMPIDKNGNGKMDYMEKIYDNFQDFSRGVWIGKYPKALTNTVYCISKTQPSGKPEIAFLNWILTSGQALMPANGYSDLVSNERQSQLYKLNEPQYIAEAPEETNSLWKITITILAFVLLISFMLDIVINRFRTGNSKATGILQERTEGFGQRNVIVPKGLYFDKSHTWAFMEQDGMVKIGIDDFLQHVTGPITSIGMKSPGVRINKGDQLCILIQKGKHLIVHSPVSGIIREFNPVLSSNSSVINNSPYSGGWVYRLEPSNWSREIEFLSMADKYKAWLSSEFTRLRDFLASSFQADAPGYARLTLQDGGILKDNILADLGPEIWEDFQTKFIDTVR